MAVSPLASPESGLGGLQPLVPRRKGEAAYHAIRRAILLGLLKAGHGLTEQHIAGELACSQGTVREALFKLEQEGLVQRRGYRGTVVSTTSVQEVSHMIRIRLSLECEAFEAIAGKPPAEYEPELAAIIDEMDQVVETGDPYLCSELDRRFHLAVMRASGLVALEPILNRCALHIHRFTYLDADLKAPDVRFAERHRELLTAATSGDAAVATDSIRRHVEDVIDTWAPELAATA